MYDIIDDTIERLHKQALYGYVFVAHYVFAVSGDLLMSAWLEIHPPFILHCQQCYQLQTKFI